MKAQGAVRWFAALFALICIYQLSFTWIASNVEKKAKAYAKGDEATERRYLDSIADQEVFNFLWLNDILELCFSLFWNISRPII